MATYGFSYGKSAAEWNVFVIFVMAWCWYNATESKPQNVVYNVFSELTQNASLLFFARKLMKIVIEKSCVIMKN